jgi:hypothetical protein
VPGESAIQGAMHARPYTVPEAFVLGITGSIEPKYSSSDAS